MGRPSYLRDSLAQTGPVPLALGIFNAEGSTGPTENIAMKAKEMPLRRQNSACSSAFVLVSLAPAMTTVRQAQ